MPVSVPVSLDLASLRAAYAEGFDPRDLIAAVAARIAAHDDPALFLARPSAEALAARAASLAGLDAEARAALPLYGVPFVVKDNIDVAGLATTAACPAFARMPPASATVVARLEAAGAIVVGKANLDQFATGLVGVRSPYGTPRNAFDARLIPGGSSSGSATSVAAGLAAFSLGTDTAGSGRVPAGLGNLVGLKPTLGLISTSGVVPACRTLDCVSIFALTTDDAFAVLEVAAGWDATDAFSRRIPLGRVGPRPAVVRVGVPQPRDRRFFGDVAGAAAFTDALDGLAAQGFTLTEIDFEPLFAVARMLYEGPWVAERMAAIEDFLTAQPEALHPVTRTIIEGARGRTAVEAFRATYRLAEAARAAEGLWRDVDILVVPTVPRAWTVDEVEADPITTNSALGTYTNFVNLLGLSALAVPVAIRADGVPAGITLIGPGGGDAALAGLGRSIEAAFAPPLGATGVARPPLVPVVAAPQGDEIGLVVVGGHLSGMALNHELTALGARYLRAVTTAPVYRLHALAGGPPFRPGMVRVAQGGAAIAAEVWALSPAAFGRFVAGIPAPLGIGTVELADGARVKGFLCEAAGLDGAEDITASGGWRAHMAARR
ncbi:allophanate hydrolase [Siculibacillus lacustris]|uniref:Allophanate hydrolase n=1 Tax=Siculibacillus lacustris TaxID=1549641 RepID=A0A4Q9VNV0_9HYPH|nr:allophanate hydrolase [Siculibacillus lacustris]TBW37352.1 allophanate hydrolase [Siculibacillus lacustris]